MNTCETLIAFGSCVELAGVNVDVDVSANIKRDRYENPTFETVEIIDVWRGGENIVTQLTPEQLKDLQADALDADRRAHR